MKMPHTSNKVLEETVVKLQLRVDTLEKYTNELVAAVDGLLATHPHDSQPVREAEASGQESQQAALDARFDALQDLLVSRLRRYLDDAVQSKWEAARTAALVSSPKEVSPSPSPTRPATASIDAQVPEEAKQANTQKDATCARIDALQHDLLQCVSQIETLMDDQQQHQEDMETCMALLVNLEKKQEALERAVESRRAAATKEAKEAKETQSTAVRSPIEPCSGCQSLQIRVHELETIVRDLCTERVRRARSEEAATLLSAAAQASTSASPSPRQRSSSPPMPLPPCGNETSLWRYLADLSGEVAAHGALIARYDKDSSPPSTSQSAPPPPLSLSVSGPPVVSEVVMREIRMDETPQALRALEARARDMQSSIRGLA